jgi:phosphoribosyl-ATP pyrophosphohydrolase
MTGFTLADLEAIIATKAQASPETSWTAKLMAGGPERCAKKMGEEAIEAALAAMGVDTAPLVAESADLLYHLLVLLAVRGVPLQDVMAELERRTGQSGLSEKASRGPG